MLSVKSPVPITLGAGEPPCPGLSTNATVSLNPFRSNVVPGWSNTIVLSLITSDAPRRSVPAAT
jgi:hypothetical protein